MDFIIIFNKMCLQFSTTVFKNRMVIIDPTLHFKGQQKGNRMSSIVPLHRPVKLFYSYSHRDARLRVQLENHLTNLKNQGFIQEWHDRKIGAGTEWNGIIDKHLQEADIILLLVSASFLASEYCRDVEIKAAMERHEAKTARTIPVILRKVDDWRSCSFGKLHVLPNDGKPVVEWRTYDAGFADVARGIREVINELATEKASAVVPSNSSVAESSSDKQFRSQHEVDSPSSQQNLQITKDKVDEISDLVIAEPGLGIDRRWFAAGLVIALAILAALFMVCFPFGTSVKVLGHWRLNGDLTDSSGNGRHAKSENGHRFESDVPLSANVNQYIFNPKHSYIDILEFTCPANNFTIEFFFRSKPLQMGETPFLISTNDHTDRDPDTQGGWCILLTKSGEAAFSVVGDTLRGNRTVPVSIVSKRSYDDGIWHHVAATLDRTNHMKLYVDGHLEAEGQGVTPAKDRNHLRFGNSHFFLAAGPNEFPYEGDFDEIRLSEGVLKPDDFLFKSTK